MSVQASASGEIGQNPELCTNFGPIFQRSATISDNIEKRNSGDPLKFGNLRQLGML